MTEHAPDISIVLLTYNGERYLSEVLSSVFAQKTRLTFEVVMIDSGSSDRTLEIAAGYPVRIIRIPNREFGHGRTRNLGVRNARGGCVVFLTQDATPMDDNWLDNLARSLLEDPRVAGAYSRQIPRPDCHPWEARDIACGAGPISAVKRIDFNDPFQRETYRAHQARFILFSNVSSCIRKSVLEQLSFAENIAMVEDQEWCKRAIEAGYTVIYEASSVVYHSHNHSLRAIYRRHFDYGISLKDFAPIAMPFRSVLLYTVIEAAADVVFIIARGGANLRSIKCVLQSPFVRFAMRYGLHKGLKASAKSPAADNLGLATDSLNTGGSGG